MGDQALNWEAQSPPPTPADSANCFCSLHKMHCRHPAQLVLYRQSMSMITPKQNKSLPAGRMLIVVGLSMLVGCGVVGTVGGMVGDQPAVQDANPDDGPSLSPFIVNGQTDHSHPSVGKLYTGGGACTATLVGQRTVLTAGHCVSPGSSSRFELNGTSFNSQRIIRHANYGGGNNNDIALVILQQAPAQNIPRSPIAVAAPQNGNSITLVGFGKTSENSNDYGTKRVGINTISSVGNATFSFQGGSNVCNGDSGGPTFINVGTQEVVYGVHSTKSGFCGSGGTDIRVDSYKDWITQQAGGDVVKPNNNPQNPGTQPPPPGQNDASTAQEGQGCWKRKCFAGLSCTAIYNGPKIIGKYCMERCRTLGQDPNCDGGEQCTKSRENGRVCFNPQNAKGGYTNGGPGSSGGGGYNPVPPGPGGGGGNNGACGNGQESGTFNLLNGVRAKNGRGALKCDMGAVNVARQYSQKMCNTGHFGHSGPNGSSPWSRLKAGGVQFSSAGENIAWGYGSPQAVHTGWMNSSGHRQNMLGSSWTRVGIGYANCNGKHYWTEVFMR
jgi:uncharacterized protein YkwD/V8-like Glu-specific endopeptidase